MTSGAFKLIRNAVAVVALFVAALIVLFHVPTVQRSLSGFVSEELGKALHTRVSIGRIAYSFPNRLIVDDVTMDDLQGKELIGVSRVSAKFQLLPLLAEGRVVIHTAQLFGAHVRLRRPDGESASNIRFLLDALAGDEPDEDPARLDLRINSLFIRRGGVTYDVEDVPETPGVFNASHLDFNGFNANISLKALRSDSVNVHIKRLQLQEKSGLRVSNLHLKLTANGRRAALTDFLLQTGESRVGIKQIQATYASDAEKGKVTRLNYEGQFSSDSRIVLRDFAPFVPALHGFDEPLKLSGGIRGTDQEIELSDLTINSLKNDLFFRLSNVYAGLPLTEESEIAASLQEVSLTPEGASLLDRCLATEGNGVAKILSGASPLKLSAEMAGTLKELNLLAFLESRMGNVEANAALLNLGAGEEGVGFQGLVFSDRLDLSPLNDHPDGLLGNIAFNFKAHGTLHPEADGRQVYLQGDIPLLQYNGYDYTHIRMDGLLDDKEGFDGLLTVDDPNVGLLLNGKFNPAGNTPSFDLTASLSHFRPYVLNLTEKFEGAEYGLKLNARFRGDNIDNIDGEINVDSLTAVLPNDFYFLNNLNVHARNIDLGRKQILATADFMQVSIEGEYAYATLPQSFVGLVEQYLPALAGKGADLPARNKAGANNFTIDATFRHSKFYAYVLGIPLKLDPSVRIKGYVNDAEGKVSLEGYAPSLTYDGDHYESALFRCENSTDEMTADIRLSRQMSGRALVNFALTAQARENHLSTRLSWGNNTPVTYSGKVLAETDFSRSETLPEFLQADIRVKPSELIINDTVWHLYESQIRLDSGKVFVDKFKIEHDNQHLIVDGKLTPEAEDSLVIDLKRIKVEYIMDILQFHPVDFNGVATGKAYVSGALSTPLADARMFIEEFRFNGGLMGDMHIYGRWDNDEGLLLDADIRERDIAHTTVKGIVSPQKEGLDLHIKADSTNLEFLNSFVGGIFSDVAGRTSGDVHLHGTFKDLILEGDVIADAHAKVDILNVPFALVRDSVHLRTDGIYFPNTVIVDREGHRGIVNGHLKHTHLRNMSYDFNIRTRALQLFNINHFGDDLPFYGNIYGTGNIRLHGGGNLLQVDGDIRTDEQTLFVYNLSTPDELTDSEFITFVDKTPRWINTEIENPFAHTEEDDEEEEEDDEPLNVIINARLNVTNDANVRVIMDTQSGDYVSAYGGGDIAVNYTNERTQIRGTYTIEEGIYKMSIQELIRKDFLIQSGSQVSFSGSGDDAALDLKAVYTVNSASLYDLMPDASFNQNTVKVNCIINMTGTLSAPDLAFDLELPTVNEEERQMVRSAISTDEQMKMQIVYLLGIGKFYTYDYANNEGRSSSDAMSSLLSSTLSGQLNNMLSQVLNMNNWNFSSNLSTGQEGWSDLEVEGILSGRLLNNRLLINGNFGYRENQLANSNFVGDFNIQWLLTPSGNIRLKAYNQTNDRYFAKTTFNTQGLGIIYKREFDNWWDFFRLRRRKKR